MFCENCGSQMADNAIFCSACGKPVRNAVPVDNNSQHQYYSNYTYSQQPIYLPPVYPTIVNVQAKPTPTHTLNGCCLASFILGMLGIFILPYICGVAAIILGIIGLVTFDEKKQNNKWQAITGIVLGILTFIVAIFLVGLVLEFYRSLLNYI